MSREAEDMMEDLRGYVGDIFDNKRTPDPPTIEERVSALEKRFIKDHRLICMLVDVMQMLRDRKPRKLMEDIINDM